ncbi:hypothetical protein [Mycolicibacterium arenosum]|uniref:Uncharacterized protein n=1 Tax=Mycolicibacterium arenosum TaxID=2952157 RepID=A0ABT1LZ74_9MYCO|nr:hypothetical protein [Mycolicibacterium sp. CAU 1645]MCP9272203.1 hypothetical protein [Mycolicibacterium sp. CAU 1645]
MADEFVSGARAEPPHSYRVEVDEAPVLVDADGVGTVVDDLGERVVADPGRTFAVTVGRTIPVRIGVRRDETRAGVCIADEGLTVSHRDTPNTTVAIIMPRHLMFRSNCQLDLLSMCSFATLKFARKLNILDWQLALYRIGLGFTPGVAINVSRVDN